MNIDDLSYCNSLNFSEHFSRFENEVLKKLTANSQEFYSALLTEEIKWIDLFMEKIHKYLNHRESQGLKIGQQDTVRCQFGDLAANRQLLTITFKKVTKSSRKIMVDLIRQMCMNLAKLAGARAFIRNNVYNMLFTFEVINQNYLVN